MNSRTSRAMSRPRLDRRLEHDAGQAIQPDELDEPLDVRLGAPKAQAGAGHPQPAGERRQGEDERRVSEGQLGEVDDHVARTRQRTRERGAAAALRRTILVTPAPQNGGLWLEVDDVRKRTSSAANTNPPVRRFCHHVHMATIEDVEAALTNVIDPELGLDFVELGLIYGIEVDGGSVHVTFSLTSPGCPIGPQVSEQIEEFVGELDGVQSVESSMVFTPAWTPERMSEDAKFALGF